VPTSVAEALTFKSQYPDAWFMAGGIDVANRLKSGAPVEDVIYLGKIAPLRSLRLSDAGVVIGSNVTHDDIAISALVKDACGGLARVWGLIANPRIRFKGTVGGNLMAAEPGYEAAALLAAADAKLAFAGPTAPTTMDQFLASPASATGLLESVTVSGDGSRCFIYDRSLKGVAGVVVSACIAGGKVSGARAAITWAYPRPVAKLISIPDGTAVADLSAFAGDAAVAWCRDLSAPLGDHLASSVYRRRMIEVKLRRGLAALAKGATP
jgi:carbon-monoxide dehydrogenase medium subunit